MKTILITGSSGMLGRELLNQLSVQGEFKVFAATTRPEQIKKAKINERSGLNLTIIGNSRIEQTMSENQIDCLLHLAFPRNASGEAYAQGIRFAFDVLSTAKKHKVSSVIHISSQSIYGLDRKEAATERTPVKLTSPYTTGKYCEEQLVNLLFEGIPHSNLRLATLVGIQSHTKVPNIFLDRLVKGEDITIEGGEQVFSFLDVRDAAEAIIAMINTSPETWQETYNLGTEENYTLMDLAQQIHEFVEIDRSTSGRIKQNEADVYLNNMIVSTFFYDDFQWKPQYTIKQSLAYIYEAMKEHV